LTDEQLNNAAFCINRCIRPVAKDYGEGRKGRMNWDMVEAKQAFEKYGEEVDFDQLIANGEQQKTKHGNMGNRDNKDNNGNAFGRTERHRRQAEQSHDDECVKKALGMTLDEAKHVCESTKGAIRIKRSTDQMTARAVKRELIELFTLKYADKIIEKFCPHSEEVVNFCINAAIQGQTLPTEFLSADDIHALYCEEQAVCTDLANQCTDERMSDITAMCECMNGLQAQIKATTCKYAIEAMDKPISACGKSFRDSVDANKFKPATQCDISAQPMSVDELIDAYINPTIF